MLRLALVEEAQPERIDGDAIGIVVAALGVAAAVLVLRRLDVGRVGVDRRHVAGPPFAGGARAEVEQHAQHLAGVVPAAAHLHQVGVAVEIARAHLGIGLEAAGAGDHRLGHEIVAAVGPAHADALDAAQVAENGADRRLEADFDAELSAIRRHCESWPMPPPATWIAMPRSK